MNPKLTKILFFTILLTVFLFSNVEQSFSVLSKESRTVQPGGFDNIDLKLFAGDTLKSAINIDGTFDDHEIKYWVVDEMGTRIIQPTTANLSTNLEFTVEKDGVYSIYFENPSRTLLNSKTVTLSYDIIGSGSGGCLIATATYGSELAPQVQQLREIRDNVIHRTHSGAVFMSAFNQFYYMFSPTIADLERQNPLFKETVRITITPLITTLSILNYADIDSETEMLGYGIGIILLNTGMYFVLPLGIIYKINCVYSTKYKA